MICDQLTIDPKMGTGDYSVIGIGERGAGESGLRVDGFV
jgi:hypothetical protein